VHTPVREDPLMKLLPMDQIWMAMKPGRVEVWAERPPEVSISNLEKKKSNLKTLRYWENHGLEEEVQRGRGRRRYVEGK
jgi:hypothetical protein